MESSGEAGAVHITEQTKAYLDASTGTNNENAVTFKFEPVVQDLKDEILHKSNIKTFLIRYVRNLFDLPISHDLHLMPKRIIYLYYYATSNPYKMTFTMQAQQVTSKKGNIQWQTLRASKFSFI